MRRPCSVILCLRGSAFGKISEDLMYKLLLLPCADLFMELCPFGVIESHCWTPLARQSKFYDIDVRFLSIVQSYQSGSQSFQQSIHFYNATVI